MTDGKMPNTEICEMLKSDVKAVAAIDRECFSVPWSEKSFMDETENEFAVYFVARHDGECIGYGGFWRVFPEGDITNVAVLPKWRRRGVATAILDKMIRRARQLGLECLNLEVRRSNTAAQRLYADTGFVVTGERKRFYSDNREDALIMKLNLNTEQC